MIHYELCCASNFSAFHSKIPFVSDFQIDCACCNLKASQIHIGLHMASLLDKSRSAFLNLGFVVFVETLVCNWCCHFVSQVQVVDVFEFVRLMCEFSSTALTVSSR